MLRAGGFQRDDPVSDLRAGGRLALEQLVYFLERYPREATAMVGRQAAREMLVDGYPWAAAGVNVSHMLLGLFDLAPPLGCSAQWRLAKRASWGLLGEGGSGAGFDPFHELFCLAFVLLDRDFDAASASYIQFNDVLAAVRQRLGRLLAGCGPDDTVASVARRAFAAPGAAVEAAAAAGGEGGAGHPWVHAGDAGTRLRATSWEGRPRLLAEPTTAPHAGSEAAGRPTLTRARSESAPVESQHRLVGGLSAAEKAEAVAAVRLEIDALRAELGLAC